MRELGRCSGEMLEIDEQERGGVKKDHTFAFKSLFGHNYIVAVARTADLTTVETVAQEMGVGLSGENSRGSRET